MNRIAIVPCTRASLGHTREFLDGYARRVEDACDIPVHVVVARAELAAAQSALAEVHGIGVTVHAFEDLAGAAFGATPRDPLGEFDAETSEALYTLAALRALTYAQAVVFDADSFVVKDVRLASIFDAYFADPYVLFSDPGIWKAEWVASPRDAVVRNASRLLRQPDPRMDFGESSGQLYEKRVIDALFNALGDALPEVVRDRSGADRRLSTQQLVGTFLHARGQAFGYRFVSVNGLLQQYLGDDGYAAYIRTLTADGAVVGVLESAARATSEQNVSGLQRLFTDENLTFYRFDPWNANQEEQQRLIDGSPIAFLVASRGYRRMRMRIAVCLSGMPRNARQNIRFVQNFLAGSEVDVFFHFWDTPEHDYIVRQLRPKAYAFEQTSIAPPPPAYRRLEKMVKPHQMRGTSSMFYSIGRANALKSAFEHANGFRYDVVVRLRLDFFSTQTLGDVLESIDRQRAGWDGVIYVPDMAHSAGVNDQLAVASSDVMDTYAAVLDTLPRVAEDDYYNPEYILLRHLLRSALRIRTFPFEYVLLRGDRVSTFDIREHVDRTLETWWSSPLPEIPQHAVTEYFAAEADSVRLIDEIDADLARVFRLRCAGRGYLHYDAERRSLDFAPDAATASLFYLVIPSDEDRTVVNIRPRELVFASVDPSVAGSAATSLYPEMDGSVRPDGPSDEDSAFFIRRRDGGILFEWRPGFWKRPDDDRGSVPRVPGGRTAPTPDDSRAARRLALQPAAAGLALAPLTPESETFDIEYVPDPAAEAVAVGLRADAPGRILVRSESLPVRLLRFTYLAARLVDQRGVRVMSDTARSYVRKRAYAAEQTNAPGVANRIMRRLANRL